MDSLRPGTPHPSTAAKWTVAEFPTRPRRPPQVVEVDDAYLTEVAVGHLATVHQPARWFRGAVYGPDDQLVHASQKVLGDRRGPRVAADPDQVTRSDDRDELAGRWLYGGTWANAYGHFITETLTTLWHTPDVPLAGLVFHANFGVHEITPWHRRFLELAGHGDREVHVVGLERPVRVQQLTVPSRSLSLHAWAHPEARQVWERIAEGFRGRGDERVHLSRTLLNEERRRTNYRRPPRTTAEYDKALDQVFADHGFSVIHPETMDVDAQLSAVASAGVVSGLSGSGLHQSAFIPAGGRVIEVGDERTASTPVRMQVAIDAAMGHERCFVPGASTPDEVAQTLQELGLG